MTLIPLPTLEQLAVDPGRVRDLPPHLAQALLLRLAPVLEALRLTALAIPGGNGQPDPPAEDRLLTPEEAAARLGVSVKWLYRHHRRLPFARKLSRRALRFSERGLQQYLAARQR